MKLNVHMYQVQVFKLSLTSRERLLINFDSFYLLIQWLITRIEFVLEVEEKGGEYGRSKYKR